MKIFGIVGWKNSGKTFFARKLIQYFVNLNYSVASIKHAHHDFDIDKPGTDSFLHRAAGATQVVISSSNRWAKIEELKNSKEKKLGELLKEIHSCDIVVVEGFKKESKHEALADILESIEELKYYRENFIKV